VFDAVHQMGISYTLDRSLHFNVTHCGSPLTKRAEFPLWRLGQIQTLLRLWNTGTWQHVKRAH